MPIADIRQMTTGHTFLHRLFLSKTEKWATTSSLIMHDAINKPGTEHSKTINSK